MLRRFEKSWTDTRSCLIKPAARFQVRASKASEPRITQTTQIGFIEIGSSTVVPLLVVCLSVLALGAILQQEQLTPPTRHQITTGVGHSQSCAATACSFHSRRLTAIRGR